MGELFLVSWMVEYCECVEKAGCGLVSWTWQCIALVLVCCAICAVQCSAEDMDDWIWLDRTY